MEAGDIKQIIIKLDNDTFYELSNITSAVYKEDYGIGQWRLIVEGKGEILHKEEKAKTSNGCQKEVKYTECCCTCANRVIMVDHETNRVTGYGCIVFLNEEGTVYYNDFKHGYCEMHVKEEA